MLGFDFNTIEIVLFLGTALIGFSLEGYLPGGQMIAPLLSCFVAGDLAWLLDFVIGEMGFTQQIMLRLSDFLTIGIGAGLGCLVGMVLGGVVGGYTGIIGPVCGGVGAVLAFKTMIS